MRIPLRDLLQDPLIKGKMKLLKIFGTTNQPSLLIENLDVFSPVAAPYEIFQGLAGINAGQLIMENKVKRGQILGDKAEPLVYMSEQFLGKIKIPRKTTGCQNNG
jgi:hypothetical protein